MTVSRLWVSSLWLSLALGCAGGKVEGPGSDDGGDGADGGDGPGDSGSTSDDGGDGATDSGTDGGTDGTTDSGADGGTDGGTDGTTDGGADGGTDGGTDGTTDSGTDGGTDGTTDSGADGGTDGTTDSGADGGTDSGADGGGSSGIPATILLQDVLVYSPDTGYGFFIMEGSGGPYSGMWVYYDDAVVTDLVVTQGDRIDLVATFGEYTYSSGSGTLSELALLASADLTVLSSGNSIPAPTIVSSAELADATSGEQWESCFVQIEDPVVTDSDLGFGEWQVDAILAVDDLYYDFAVTDGDLFSSIAGPLYFSYGAFKLAPRDAGDLLGHVPYTVPCGADRCVSDLAPGDLVITEVMSDPYNGGACADPAGEYLEIYNPGASSVDLANLDISDNSASYTVTSTLVVPAGGFVWLENISACYTSLVPNGTYESLALGNSGDTLTLSYADSSGAEVVVDTVTYSARATRGAAKGLSTDRFDATLNDDWANWCDQTATISGSTDLGTPGSPNIDCTP
jgi:Lamin Tail Domain